MNIKAIDTVYNGYRFRSRLEARWAVFFDAVDAKYEYETQGYELPSGRYLPDFWLPEEGVFVEIKPGTPPRAEDYIHSREVVLAYELAVASGCAVYLLYGDPATALAPEYPGMISFKGDIESENDGLSFLYLRDYETAAIRARQARFEHGQNGAS